MVQTADALGDLDREIKDVKNRIFDLRQQLENSDSSNPWAQARIMGDIAIETGVVVVLQKVWSRLGGTAE